MIQGILSDENVLITDIKESSQLYNKGYHGEPQSGGTLKLDLVESAYLLDVGRISITQDNKEMNLEDLMAYAIKCQPNFEIKYLVYRDLRERGYVAKPSPEPFDFRLYPRGGVPGKTPTRAWVLALSERSEFNIQTFFTYSDRAMELKKEFLVGIVDEEGDVTYYQVSRAHPKGRFAGTLEDAINKSKMNIPVNAFLLEDLVLVWDEEFAKVLSSEFFGKVSGKYLQLSLIETTYLVEKGLIQVKNAKTGKMLTERTLKQKGAKVQSDFGIRLAAYRALKSEGAIVKTGFKYGTHFRIYEGDPTKQHARYLLHAVPKSYKSSWPEVSRAVRLAQGVRKEMLFAMVGEDKVDYLKLSRIKP